MARWPTTSCFVATRQREFDHPSGEQNVYASYTGKGGVPIGNLLRRAVFAAQFGSSKILFSRRHHRRQPGALQPGHR